MKITIKNNFKKQLNAEIEFSHSTHSFQFGIFVFA